ncbi:hypothetical protein [Kosakonia phage Kc283]|uniref:Uncharacterized protein n=1 Tax=Kosakonia phage Kc283 TaxID=2863195 RepID=A0AAE8BII0_9CAUD|nr:hypothetical protein PP755_gp89 [Kosakonia phage Kc283]QYN79884.1 hypothetical protein [Kosakonia phage Kc283]
MSDLEQKIVAAGADKAPRLTPDYIKSMIKSEFFFTAEEGVQGHQFQTMYADEVHGSGLESMGLLTVCVLVLENGFTIVGHSACASPENFNFEIGCDVARENAIEQIWLLEGYRLKQRLFEEAQTKAALAEFAENNKCEGGGCTI